MIAGDNGDTGLPVAYLAQGSMRSASLALLIGCDERVGFETSAARALYTRCVAYDPHRHHAERLWQLGAGERAADPPAEARQLRLYPGADDMRAVDRLLQQARCAGEPLVAVAPGSAWATKRWPYYPALTSALLSDWRVVVVGGSADQSRAAEIITAAGRNRSRVIDATGRLTPLATAALLGQCVGVGHQRLRASAPGVGDGHTHSGDLRTDRPRIWIRSARASSGDRRSYAGSPAAPVTATDRAAARSGTGDACGKLASPMLLAWSRASRPRRSFPELPHPPIGAGMSSEPRDRYIVGVDLGGTNIVVGAMQADGSRQFAIRSQPTQPERGANAVVDRIAQMIEDVIAATRAETGAARADFLGVGIGSPGPLDRETGIVIITPNLGWRDFPLRDAVATRVGLPSTLDNDANCATVGEWWCGAARGRASRHRRHDWHRHRRRSHSRRQALPRCLRRRR